MAARAGGVEATPTVKSAAATIKEAREKSGRDLGNFIKNVMEKTVGCLLSLGVSKIVEDKPYETTGFEV